MKNVVTYNFSVERKFTNIFVSGNLNDALRNECYKRNKNNFELFSAKLQLIHRTVMIVSE